MREVMNMTGQLQLGAVEVVSPGTGELIGYAYTVASNGGQMQRWLLYRDPKSSLAVRSPSEKMASWTLRDWQSKVRELWKPNSFYVWAQSTIRPYDGEDGVTWKQIPRADALPPVKYPVVEGADLQLDPTGGKVLDLTQPGCAGVVFTVGGLQDASNAEYWMLPAEYKPAGRYASKVAVGTADAKSLQDFIDVANRSWGPGCMLVITGCINYHGEVAPRAP
jgi:hypothetical protein